MNINNKEYFENVTLEEAIAEFNKWNKSATSAPWYVSDEFLTDDDDEDSICYSIGPFDMSNKVRKHPYENTIADFIDGNHNAKGNAYAVALAMFLVPKLIERIRELELKSSTELSDDVNNAIDALLKWKNTPN